MWLCNIEIALQQVRRHLRRWRRRAVPYFVAAHWADFMKPHQSRNAMFAAGLTGLPEFQKDPWRTVNSVAGHERGSDETQQPGVVLLPS
jgi:hypothetical protein